MCGFDLEKRSEKLVAPSVSQHQDFRRTTSISSKLSQPNSIPISAFYVLVPRLSGACARPPQLTDDVLGLFKLVLCVYIMSNLFA